MAGRAVTEVLIGGTQVVAATVSAPLGRSHYNHWGASADEVASGMPGDELVPQPRLGYTRAITIAAPPRRVWPWLAQIGHGRGGLYSYDGLENLVGCDIHSADEVLPEHQDLDVGDLIRLGPEGYPCFRVAEVVPDSALVLIGADPKPPHAAAEPGSPGGLATWQWQLRRDPLGGTRLLVRQRLTYPRSMSLLWHVVEPVAFVMERRMLLGIRQRAERMAASPQTRAPAFRA